MLERDNRIGIISKIYSIAKNCKSNFFIASKDLIKVTHEHKIIQMLHLIKISNLVHCMVGHTLHVLHTGRNCANSRL